MILFLAIVEFCVEHKSSTKALISFSKHAFVLFSQPRFRLHFFSLKISPRKRIKDEVLSKYYYLTKSIIYKGERRAILLYIDISDISHSFLIFSLWSRKLGQTRSSGSILKTFQKVGPRLYYWSRARKLLLSYT